MVRLLAKDNTDNTPVRPASPVTLKRYITPNASRSFSPAPSESGHRGASPSPGQRSVSPSTSSLHLKEPAEKRGPLLKQRSASPSHIVFGRGHTAGARRSEYERGLARSSGKRSGPRWTERVAGIESGAACLSQTVGPPPEGNTPRLWPRHRPFLTNSGRPAHERSPRGRWRL